MGSRETVTKTILRLISRVNIDIPKTLFGHRRIVPARGNLALFYLTRGYSQPTWKTAIFSRHEINERSCFIDAGVNVGQTLLELKSVHPETVYHGFEPNSFCAYYVQELIKSNGFQDATLHSYALSEMPMSFELHLSSYEDTSAGATLVH